MARSVVSIYNQALARLGGEQLESVESTWEDSALGRLCNNNFPEILDEALSRHDWSFALKSQALALKGESDRPDYIYRYGLPTDCLRAVELLSGGTFVIEGIDILTSTSPPTLLYVTRVEDPRRWPPAFATSLSWALAATLATSKVNDKQMQQYCLQNYEITIADAIARDLNQSLPVYPRSKWVLSRGGEL
ncbi:hypothetical protein C4J81_17140 [Deltaproteobacteria bacterium Smac51]|nr:hypothetical protein C4J81_17140 [Deltaproteobacteria bacterium Smac51]